MQMAIEEQHYLAVLWQQWSNYIMWTLRHMKIALFKWNIYFTWFFLKKTKLLKVKQIEHYIKSIASGDNNNLNSMPFSKKIISLKPVIELCTSIMSNVHSTPISRFPPKELSDIDQHKCSIHKHRISNSAIHFILHSKCPRN